MVAGCSAGERTCSWSRLRSMLLVALVLGGCGSDEDPYFISCQALLEEALKSPASLQIVHQERLEEYRGFLVRIEFDAANSFGALLRSVVMCEYSKSSSPDESPERGSNVYLQAMRANRLVRKLTIDGELIGEQCGWERDECIGSTLALFKLKDAAMKRLGDRATG